MKTVIDANVILRYILDDETDMAETAARIIQNGAKTLPEVIAEVVYVLAKVYKASREDINAYIETVSSEIEMDRRDVILYAVRLFGETRLDFVDCILIAYHRIDKAAIFSFDKKLNRILDS